MFSTTDVSHINMLPYQTPGVLNQALVFMRDVKMFASRTDILIKSAIFDNTPAKKWFGPRICVPWNFLKNLIPTIWDSFHDGASSSYDIFFTVSRTDRMLTLNWSHSRRRVFVFNCLLFCLFVSIGVRGGGGGGAGGCSPPRIFQIAIFGQKKKIM